MTQLRNFPLLIPPRPLQEKFGEYVKVIQNGKRFHEQKLGKMHALFACLQQRAFRREI
jgi:restriction endonuclease S subunit